MSPVGGAATPAPPERPDRILVVEDERDIAALLAYQLTKDGFSVETVADGLAALAVLEREVPDLVVLDLMLPGLSGHEVLQAIRRDERSAETPILLLTALQEQDDRIRGLEMGADDYLTKPFSPRELVLRVQAVLRRARQHPPQGGDRVLKAGSLRVDLDRVSATLDGRDLTLTPTEFRLLRAFLEKPDRTLRRETLLARAWDIDADRSSRIHTRTVDMHVRRLRSKLGDFGERIETVRGFGYRFAQRGVS